MKASRPALVLMALLLAAGALVPGAEAQIGGTFETDTLTIVGRSAYEEGYLSLFDMDRVAAGGRMTGMGGTGLALYGGPEYLALNPASILGVEQMELEAEVAYYGGGAGVNEYPAQKPLGDDVFLNSSNYRVSQRSKFDYNNLSFGLPIVMFGGRGAMVLSYRRVARTGHGVETRTSLQSNAFQTNEPVNYGLGDTPDLGLDVIGVGAAREMAPWLDLGVGLNFQTGTLEREWDTGISQFGFVILEGSEAFKQDVSAFNVDLGARLQFGDLALAGAMYLGYDLKFRNGVGVIQPLRGTTIETQYRLNQDPQDQTTTVPTMIGLGGAYDINDRFTVAADFWIRPWSNSEITRRALGASIGFADMEDSTTYYANVELEDGMETLNARMEDTNSLRLGLEYKLVQNQTYDVPIWLGYRHEKRTITNTELPPEMLNYPALVVEYYQQLVADEVDPNLEQQLLDLVEHKDLLARGSAVNANVFTAGIGINIDNFGAEISFESTRYDYDNYFLYRFEPEMQYWGTSALTDQTRESRSYLTVSIATRMRF